MPEYAQKLIESWTNIFNMRQIRIGRVIDSSIARINNPELLLRDCNCPQGWYKLSEN